MFTVLNPATRGQDIRWDNHFVQFTERNEYILNTHSHYLPIIMRCPKLAEWECRCCQVLFVLVGCSWQLLEVWSNMFCFVAPRNMFLSAAAGSLALVISRDVPFSSGTAFSDMSMDFAAGLHAAGVV